VVQRNANDVNQGVSIMLLFVHVALSLVGLATGFVVIWGMFNARPLDRWTAVFLATTLLTSLTGFLFPIHGFTPGIGLGIISLPVLGLAIFARHGRHLAGPWRKVFVITAVVAQYLNFFVLIVQSFMKIPALHDLAPTQSEPPFLGVQIVSLVAFVALGAFAVKRFRA
jgi:hypothetical protein